MTSKNLKLLLGLAVANLLTMPAAAQAQEEYFDFSGDVQVRQVDPSRPLLDQMGALAGERLAQSNASFVYVGYGIEVREELRSSSWVVNRSGRFHSVTTKHKGYVSISCYDGIEYEGIEPAGSEYKAALFRYNREGAGGRLYRINILDGGDPYRFTVPLVWLRGVEQAGSVQALGRTLESGSSERLCEDTLPAIALHKGSEPGRILKSTILGNRSVDLKEDAIFWFGMATANDDISELQELEGALKNGDLREKIVFAYYMKRSRPAVDRIVHIARNDSSREVRKQAIFWMGQLAGEKLADELESITVDDPDTELKKQAVFALSQMEDPSGLDRLIKIARTNENPEVRKSAIFWIGQSDDERAVDILAEILK